MFHVLYNFQRAIHMHHFVCPILFSIVMFFCISCTYHQDCHLYEDKLACIWNNHKQLVSKISYYQIQGSIVYAINCNKKSHVRFIWIQNNNDYSIKLLNVFGLIIISISIENGVVRVSNGIIYQNNDFKNEMQKHFMKNMKYFSEQLRQWILGLPGKNTEYNLNSMGYLSNIHFSYNDSNVYIYYRHYNVYTIPVLPKILEVYYDQYYIKLIINNWIIR